MQSWRDLRTLPRPIWTLFFATLVNRTGSMALPFLTLYLIREAGFSALAAGGVLSFYGAIALVAGPLSGRLVDRIGPVRVMQGALLGTGLLQVLFPLAHTTGAVLALAGLWSMAAETYRPAALSATAALAPEGRRREAYALIRLAINLGMSIGPAVGGFLAGWDFRLIFLVDGATSLLAGAVLVAQGLPLVARPLGGGDAADRGAAPPSYLWTPLANPALVVFLVSLLCYNLVSFQGESTMAVFLVNHLGLSPQIYGLQFTLNTVLIVALEIPLTSRLARFAPRHVLAVGMALNALGFGALGWAHGMAGVVATVIVWTFGEMVFSPTSSAYIADLAPEGSRGQYMGLYTGVHSLAYMIAAPLGLWSLERFGRGHWGLVGFVGLVGILVLLPWRRRPV